jgi:amino acid transporter
MATIPRTAKSRQSLQHGQLGLFGVIMPGVAQVAPAFNLFFTTGLMVGLAGASVPLIFLISMVGMVATASSLAQFSSIYPSAGSFITYITRAIGTKVGVAVGVITILGYIIAFGGIYIFVGSYIVQNVFGDPHVWGLTQIVTIAYGVLVVAPVVVGLKFGVRVTVALYAFEVILLLVMSITILARGGHNGLSGTPFSWPYGSTDVLLTFSLAVLAFGGFEAAAPLAEETQNPRRNVPIAVIGAVLISGFIYVIGSYALVVAFGVGHTSVLAADPNPFHTAAQAFIPFVAPLVTWIFLTSVTSSYVAANTQTSRVIFAGARGGLWSRSLAAVSPRFHTPARAAVAFVAPSIAIGVISTAFTDRRPGQPVQHPALADDRADRGRDHLRAGPGAAAPAGAGAGAGPARGRRRRGPGPGPAGAPLAPAGGGHQPVILVRVSRTRRISGSSAGRACSPRARMSLSTVIASPSRPVA